jgi:hypothetical protein
VRFRAADVDRWLEASPVVEVRPVPFDFDARL